MNIKEKAKRAERSIKVIQFGEGNFLRAFADYFIDILNEKTEFDGDIAKERIAYADEIMKLGDYKTVGNLSYYAVFSAMRAVLALDGFDFKKHSGIILEFRKNYLKTELLPKELSPMIDGLVEARQGSDYDDFYIISKEKVEEQLENSKRFIIEVEKFLNTKYYKMLPPFSLMIGGSFIICVKTTYSILPRMLLFN